MTNLRSGLAFLRAAMELSSLVIGSRSLSLGSAYLMTKGTWPRWCKSDSKCLKWSNVWYLDLSSEKRRNSASNFDLTSTVPSNWNDRTEWFIIVCRFVKALNSHCVSYLQLTKLFFRRLFSICCTFNHSIYFIFIARTD